MIPSWRWRQNASPKGWCPRTRLHVTAQMENLISRSTFSINYFWEIISTVWLRYQGYAVHWPWNGNSGSIIEHNDNSLKRITWNTTLRPDPRWKADAAGSISSQMAGFAICGPEPTNSANRHVTGVLTDIRNLHLVTTKQLKLYRRSQEERSISVFLFLMVSEMGLFHFTVVWI